MILVLPYIEKNIEYYEKYYDSIIIPECVRNIHPKEQLQNEINGWLRKVIYSFVMLKKKVEEHFQH